jgi:hypothetical protein
MSEHSCRTAHADAISAQAHHSLSHCSTVPGKTRQDLLKSMTLQYLRIQCQFHSSASYQIDRGHTV